MAKNPFKQQKIFASGLTPSNNVAQAGSLKAGTPVYSADPDVLQALAAWAGGLQNQLVPAPGGDGLNCQALEELNGILLVLSYGIAYLQQEGVPEWNAGVTYYTGSWAKSTGQIYVSLVDNNTGNAVTDPTKWTTLAATLVGPTKSVLKAWVVFDGRTGAIDSSFNVGSVSRTSAGVYLVNFSAAMADANYGFVGSAGSRPGVGFLSGDDNYICGGVNGRTIIRTNLSCTIFCFDRPNNALEDAGIISVQFFGN